MRQCPSPLVLVLLLLPGCALFAPPAEPPGLGEIMTLTQMRHAKLWFAGQAGNWPLAAYELDELNEGFDDAVRFHPAHKNAPVRVSEALPAMTARSLAELDAAISARDLARFTAAYDSLTAACNSCHEAMRFEFNVVKRPTENPYSNQSFAPAAPAAQR